MKQNGVTFALSLSTVPQARYIPHFYCAFLPFHSLGPVSLASQFRFFSNLCCLLYFEHFFFSWNCSHFHSVSSCHTPLHNDFILFEHFRIGGLLWSKKKKRRPGPTCRKSPPALVPSDDGDVLLSLGFFLFFL